MSQEWESIIKIVGLIAVLLGIYAVWRRRVQKEVNNERDIQELREKVENNRKRIDELDNHYKEMVNRFYDFITGKKR